MALALAGVPEDYSAYLDRLEDYVTRCYQQQGCLHPVKVTEYHRIALTVLALGGDPTAFGLYDGETVDLIAQGTYAYGGELGAQGLNGYVYALLTLDAGDFAVPQDARYTRQSIREAILAAQEPDGGFGLVSGSSDVDITAMALQALAPYREDCPDAIDRALGYLATQMSERCTFASYGAESAESIAQTIIALCALGIDPAEDERFLRGDSSLPQALERFRLSDGSYCHATEDPRPNLMASEQSLLALLALDRLAQGQRLFDFTQLTPSPAAASSGSLRWLPLPLAALLGGGVFVFVKRRKHHGKTDR